VKVSQISVFLENKSGRLAEVAKLLADNGINIRALSIADTSDFGILRLIVDNPEKAAAVLRDSGLAVSLTDVIAVLMKDKPGGLSEVVQILSEANINIEYMYAFVTRSDEQAVVVLRVEQLDKAIAALVFHGTKLLTGEDLYRI